MLRVAKFIYDMGRRKGYAEVIGKLEHLQTTVTRTREGENARKEIVAIIDELKIAQKDDEVYNDKADA